jgi:glycosyltransferase involved in cell wall biosynthesis
MQDEFPFFKGYKKKIYYIPNGIDMQRIAPLIPSSSIKENNILHVARLGFHVKASDLVLTIFKSVFKEFPEWRLVLIGPMMDDFKKMFLDFMAENSPIGNKISYLGFIGEPRERLYEQYGKAKILLIPSRSESFGIAAVEAGAFGGVILGTDLPSIRDITKDGSYGYLCPIDNMDCFTRKLRYMIKEEAELDEKSRLISDFVRINFDWSKICCDINRLIQEQLERRRSSNDNV